MLTKHFLEDFFCIAGNQGIFQQDNAPIPVSSIQKRVLEKKRLC